jgi:hypothetical protein
MKLETSLPHPLTAARLRQILELKQPKIDRLTRSLNRRSAHVWRAAGYDGQKFCQSLADFIGTPKGLTRYQEAAREVQNEEPGWRLTIDGAIFRDIRRRFVVNPDFIAIFPYGVAAEIRSGDFDNIRRFLAASEHLSLLEEFDWATNLGTGPTTFLKESAEGYAQVAEDLDETPEGTTAAAEEPGSVAQEAPHTASKVTLTQIFRLVAGKLNGTQEGSTAAAEEPAGEYREAFLRRLQERGGRARGHRDHADAQQPPSQGILRSAGGDEIGINSPEGGASPRGPRNQLDPQVQDINRHHQLRLPQEAMPTDSPATLGQVLNLPRLRGGDRRVMQRPIFGARNRRVSMRRAVP